jgi:hypothetical protein
MARADMPAAKNSTVGAAGAPAPELLPRRMVCPRNVRRKCGTQLPSQVKSSQVNQSPFVVRLLVLRCCVSTCVQTAPGSVSAIKVNLLHQRFEGDPIAR